MDTIIIFNSEPSFWTEIFPNYLQGIGTIVAIIALYITYRQIRHEMTNQNDILKHMREDSNFESQRYLLSIRPTFVHDGSAVSETGIGLNLKNTNSEAYNVVVTQLNYLLVKYHGNKTPYQHLVLNQGTFGISFENHSGKEVSQISFSFYLEFKDKLGNTYRQNISWNGLGFEINNPSPLE